MTIQQMRYYLTVCQLQNVTRAAEKLHIAQSTLSQAMQTLEKETGLNLFQHVGRNIIVTQEGQKLLKKVQELLLVIDRFDEDVAELAKSRNHVRLALPPQLATELMPVLLKNFKTLHPDIKLEITETSGAGAAQLVLAEEVDFAVINLGAEKNPELNYKPIAKKEICFIVWEGHPLAKKNSVSFADIAAEPIVMLGQEFFVTRKILREMKKRDLEPNVIYYSKNLSTLVSILQHHVTAGILSTQALAAQHNLVLIPFSEPQFLTTSLVTKRGRQIYHDQRVLMNFLQNR